MSRAVAATTGVRRHRPARLRRLWVLAGAAALALALPAPASGRGPPAEPGVAQGLGVSQELGLAAGLGPPAEGDADASGDDAPPGLLEGFDPPLVGQRTPRGTGELVPAEPIAPASHRSVDADPGGWAGRASAYAGVSVRSAGELVYTDHLFDAYGADDGTAAGRRDVLRPLESALPPAERLEAAATLDPAGLAGFDAPPPLGRSGAYGQAGYEPAADLTEVRVAVPQPLEQRSDSGSGNPRVWLLARTAARHRDAQTGVLVLADTRPGPGADEPREVGFNSGLTTRAADTAVLLAGDRGWIADLAADEVRPLPPGSVATDPSGFANATEAAIDRAALAARDGSLRLAVATGLLNGSGSTFADADVDATANVANVAFRPDEPVRQWFEQRQALALGEGTIDAFLRRIDVAALQAGVSERFEPGPGYHERVFTSTTPGLAVERGRRGKRQHYGVYLPPTVDGLDAAETLPVTYWLHWRGGTAHAAAAITPGVLQDLGADHAGIVVSPSGRGESSWYVGAGHADVLEVMVDAQAALPIDADRRYLAGHSMGGWGAYLFAIAYPDRFAGAMPVAGPVTQGAWTGLDLDACSAVRHDLIEDGGDLCYIAADGGRPRDQHIRPLLANLRHVPVAMAYGTADELVPYPGALAQHQRLLELGIPHRFSTFHGYEHFSHPLLDQWGEGAAHVHRQRRESPPARVTYVRDMAFERAVNEINRRGLETTFTLDSAYWLAHLEPADPKRGRATFDGTSHALDGRAAGTALTAGGPIALDQLGPFTYTGLRRVPAADGAAGPRDNAFDAELTGARAATLDLTAMGLESGGRVSGDVTTDGPLALTLAGDWAGAPSVTVARADGDVVERDTLPVSDGRVTVELDAGRWRVTLRPATTRR